MSVWALAPKKYCPDAPALAHADAEAVRSVLRSPDAPHTSQPSPHASATDAHAVDPPQVALVGAARKLVAPAATVPAVPAPAATPITGMTGMAEVRTGGGWLSLLNAVTDTERLDDSDGGSSVASTGMPSACAVRIDSAMARRRPSSSLIL